MGRNGGGGEGEGMGGGGRNGGGGLGGRRDEGPNWNFEIFSSSFLNRSASSFQTIFSRWIDLLKIRALG